MRRLYPWLCLAVWLGGAPAGARTGAEVFAFEPAPTPARFVARAGGAQVEVACDALTLAFTDRAEKLRIAFVGADRAVRPDPEARLPGRVHRLLGRDPARWRRNLPRYARVVCRELFPAIDLVVYGRAGGLEFDLRVRPGAELSALELEVRGADAQTLTPLGDLELEAGAHRVHMRKPHVYQEIDGARRPIASRFVRAAEGRLGFAVAAYDASLPLVIDPVLEFASFAGGDRSEFGEALAVDASGFVYVAGTTDSDDFPASAGAFQGEYAGGRGTFDRGDAFVMKLALDGASLVWATYFGGDDADDASGIAVGPAGEVWFAGSTFSRDLPVRNAFQPERNRRSLDAYVARLTPAGDDLVYSTYLGGRDGDAALDLAVDASGHAYVTGYSFSKDFPTTPGSFQPARGGRRDAFVVKLAPDGTSLVYGTLLGNRKLSAAFGVAVDGAGSAVVVGETDDDRFPTTEAAFQPEYQGEGDAFVTKLTPDGAGLEYSTYLGGDQGSPIAFDAALDVALDPDGNAYVTGETLSRDFPTTPDAFDPNCGGDDQCQQTDAFVAKLSPTGCALVYGTLLGEGSPDEGRAIAVDGRGHAHVAGFTLSQNFPVTNDAFQPTKRGAADAFYSELGPAGDRLVYSSYLGGGDDDAANDVALTGALRAQLAGSTFAENFPVTAGAFQSEQAGPVDAFVAAFGGLRPVVPALVASIVTTPSPAVTGMPVESLLTVRNAGNAAAVGVTLVDSLDSALTFDAASPSQGSCSFAAPALSCLLGDLAPAAAATVSVDVTPNRAGVLVQEVEVATGIDQINRAADCVLVEVHDLAVTAIRAPKSVKLPAGGMANARVNVEIQNRSSHVEEIADLGVLEDLVALSLTPTGPSCPAPLVTLDPDENEKLPVALASKKKLKVAFRATIACADEDYRAAASAAHDALDGLPDSHPIDDSCPRGPSGVDPNPDGSIDDKGCGQKQADGTLGADVVIEVELR